MATKSAKNKGGGPEHEKAQSLKKAATSSKGRHDQPKGSAKHNTDVKSAKKQKNPTTSPVGEMEF
jgi:hypothetical protein